MVSVRGTEGTKNRTSAKLLYRWSHALSLWQGTLTQWGENRKWGEEGQALEESLSITESVNLLILAYHRLRLPLKNLV